MKLLAFLIVLLFATPSAAADRALIINDQEREVLIQFIDAAVRAQGLAVARNAVILADKINTAPVVTGRTEKPEEKPPDKPAERPPAPEEKPPVQEP